MYFEALEKFGISSVIFNFKESKEFDKIMIFLKTHLIGCAKELNSQLFKELTQFLFVSHHNLTRDTFTLSQIDLGKILHYRTEKAGSVFCKTALNWANENNDRFMALELLKLEEDVHDSEVKGLECLRNNLSSDALLPWIIESYSKFYEQSPASRWSEAVCTVFIELILLSYVPFMYDLYSDISLAISYYGFAYVNETFDDNELVTCLGSQVSFTCYERTGSDNAVSFYTNSTYDTLEETSSSENIRHMFEVAFWTTLVSIIVSTFFYFCCISFDASPRPLTLVSDKILVWGRNRNWNPVLVKAVAKFCHLFLVILCKLLWPFVHISRRIQYLASTKRSQHKERRSESDEAWNNIKTVEYGIESSLQLFLQLWLLRPFLPDITVWSSTDMVQRCVTGKDNV